MKTCDLKTIENDLTTITSTNCNLDCNKNTRTSLYSQSDKPFESRVPESHISECSIFGCLCDAHKSYSLLALLSVVCKTFYFVVLFFLTGDFNLYFLFYYTLTQKGRVISLKNLCVSLYHILPRAK